MSVERSLCVVRKVFAFKIPPTETSGGHKAKSWDQTPIWTGRLRVSAKDNKLKIALEHTDKDGIFAETEVKDKRTVEQVVDSSRYFVLRVERAGRHAFIGIGFDSRDEAFDFKVSLQDFENESTGAEKAKKAMADMGPLKDLSLAPDQKISVNLKGKHRADSKKKPSASPSGGLFALAPPPADGGGARGKDKKEKKKKKDSKKKEEDVLGGLADAFADMGGGGAGSAAAADDFDPFAAMSGASASGTGSAQKNTAGDDDWVNF